MPCDNEARSTRFYTPGIIDDAAWFRVAAKDYETLISACDFTSALQPVRTLFDAGCGLGKFPALLAPSLKSLSHGIEVDFLDPSRHCIDQLPGALAEPFLPRLGIHERVENFAPGTDSAYDLVWAIQSIYAWNRGQLASSLAKLEALAGTRGDVLIFHAATPAFYHRFHDAYRAGFAPEIQAYITAEEISDALDTTRYRQHVLRFDHVIRSDDAPLLEAYLRQMCFDPSKSLEDFKRAETTHSLLEECEGEGEYRFAQEVWLTGTHSVMQRLLPAS